MPTYLPKRNTAVGGEPPQYVPSSTTMMGSPNTMTRYNNQFEDYQAMMQMAGGTYDPMSGQWYYPQQHDPYPAPQYTTAPYTTAAASMMNGSMDGMLPSVAVEQSPPPPAGPPPHEVATWLQTYVDHYENIFCLERRIPLAVEEQQEMLLALEKEKEKKMNEGKNKEKEWKQEQEEKQQREKMRKNNKSIPSSSTEASTGAAGPASGFSYKKALIQPIQEKEQQKATMKRVLFPSSGTQPGAAEDYCSSEGEEESEIFEEDEDDLKADPMEYFSTTHTSPTSSRKNRKKVYMCVKNKACFFRRKSWKSLLRHMKFSCSHLSEGDMSYFCNSENETVLRQQSLDKDTEVTKASKEAEGEKMIFQRSITDQNTTIEQQQRASFLTQLAQKEKEEENEANIQTLSTILSLCNKKQNCDLVRHFAGQIVQILSLSVYTHPEMDESLVLGFTAHEAAVARAQWKKKIGEQDRILFSQGNGKFFSAYQPYLHDLMKHVDELIALMEFSPGVTPTLSGGCCSHAATIAESLVIVLGYILKIDTVISQDCFYAEEITLPNLAKLVTVSQKYLLTEEVLVSKEQLEEFKARKKKQNPAGGGNANNDDGSVLEVQLQRQRALQESTKILQSQLESPKFIELQAKKALKEAQTFYDHHKTTTKDKSRSNNESTQQQDSFSSFTEALDLVVSCFKPHLETYCPAGWWESFLLQVEMQYQKEVMNSTPLTLRVSPSASIDKPQPRPQHQDGKAFDGRLPQPVSHALYESMGVGKTSWKHASCYFIVEYYNQCIGFLSRQDNHWQHVHGFFFDLFLKKASPGTVARDCLRNTESWILSDVFGFIDLTKEGTFSFRPEPQAWLQHLLSQFALVSQSPTNKPHEWIPFAPNHVGVTPLPNHVRENLLSNPALVDDGSKTGIFRHNEIFSASFGGTYYNILVSPMQDVVPFCDWSPALFIGQFIMVTPVTPSQQKASSKSPLLSSPFKKQPDSPAVRSSGGEAQKGSIRFAIRSIQPYQLIVKVNVDARPSFPLGSEVRIEYLYNPWHYSSMSSAIRSEPIQLYLKNLTQPRKALLRHSAVVDADIQSSSKTKTNSQKKQQDLLHNELAALLPNVPLDPSQKESIYRVLTMGRCSCGSGGKEIEEEGGEPSLLTIWGPPGCGKTHVVVNSIKAIVKGGRGRVLACASSQYATNLLALQLQKAGMKVLRIFTDSVSPYDVLKSQFRKLLYISKPKFKDPLEDHVNIETTFSRVSMEDVQAHDVICCTTAHTAWMQFHQTDFSYVFIDEAGQALDAEVLIPMTFSRTFAEGTGRVQYANLVLAGDPKQLGPAILSPVAEKYGLKRSFLDKYCHLTEDSRLEWVLLTECYRCPQPILDLFNGLFYGGKLISAVPEDSAKRGFCRTYHRLPKRNYPIMFVDVPASAETSRKHVNPAEADVAIEIIRDLTEKQGDVFSEKEMVILTPYQQQQILIRGRLFLHQHKHVDVMTIDQFQGQERLIVIISSVTGFLDYKLGGSTQQNQAASTNGGESTNKNTVSSYCSKAIAGLVGDRNRTNVALSRAQGLLIIVGNMDDLSKNDPEVWGEIVQRLKDHQCIVPSRHFRSSAPGRNASGVEFPTFEPSRTVLPKALTVEIEEN